MTRWITTATMLAISCAFITFAGIGFERPAAGSRLLFCTESSSRFQVLSGVSREMWELRFHRCRTLHLQ